MRFPGRRDYIDFLVGGGLVGDEGEFIQDSALNEEVYLDWLLRGQVGCIFAQIFGRRRNRTSLHTVVVYGDGENDPAQLSGRIDAAACDAVTDSHVEALSVILPTVLTSESLVRLLISLSTRQNWRVELERRWRRTLTLVGIRLQIADNVWAEVLGMGPFAFLPQTQQSPVTSIEIRTKTERAKRSKIHPDTLAGHLADISTVGLITRGCHRILFNALTPQLRLRILGGRGDARAKAGITFAVPAALWDGLKPDRP